MFTAEKLRTKWDFLLPPLAHTITALYGEWIGTPVFLLPHTEYYLFHIIGVTF